MAKLTITVEVNDTQQSILNNDLLDINTWVQSNGRKNKQLLEEDATRVDR